MFCVVGVSRIWIARNERERVYVKIGAIRGGKKTNSPIKPSVQ